MSRQIVSTNIRFDLGKEPDRTAWEYLQQRNKRQYRSYSRAVIAAVNDHFERRGRLAADPYLETREKEDAFLQRVLKTIQTGLNHAASTNSADALLQLLQGIQPKAEADVEVSQQDQQEAEDMALDFVDGF